MLIEQHGKKMKLEKVLVLGSTGMIGHIVVQELNKQKNFKVFNLSKSRLDHQTIIFDILKDEEIGHIISKISPKYVINCIGLLNKENNQPYSKFKKINELLPKKLSELSNKLNFKLIHMSTDCVFSGMNGPYDLESKPDAKDNYGLSKANGEKISKTNLIIRTSVIGPDLKGDSGELFDWFMLQSNSIQGYKNVFWSGVTTYELSRALIFAMKNNISGLRHLSMKKGISKYELLSKLKNYTNRDVKINAFTDKNSNKILISDNWSNMSYQNYDDLLNDMICKIKSSQKYSHYNL